MGKIRNYDQLIGKGDAPERVMVLDMLEAVLERVDAGKRIRSLMSYDGRWLTVGERRWDLSGKRNVYLLGAGKACNAMASAVCDILGTRITRGVICVKIVEPQDAYCNTRVYVGGHPLPNQEGQEAAREMLRMIGSAGEEDLFIAVFSGGSSALLTYPVEGITLEDEIATQDLLLKSGAKILEINAVRRHISRTNGGRLLEAIQGRGAELITLMVGDGVGTDPVLDRRKPAAFYGTQVAPDLTTIRDARNAITNYDLFERLPKSVTDYLWNDHRVRETPKEQGKNATLFLLDNVPSSCEEAVAVAAQKKVPLIVFSTFLEGESREAGYLMAALAREIQANRRPISPPCYVVCSGETTTRIEGEAGGTGGPSHELVAGFSLGIGELQGVAIASIDTEGTDGTTRYAGGITDTYTLRRLTEQGINLHQVLREHSTCGALEAVGDNIFTGNTGTNLCDFNVMYISK